MKTEIEKLIADYTKQSEKLRAKADKDFYGNRANVAYNLEADILNKVVFDLKAIIK